MKKFTVLITIAVAIALIAGYVIGLNTVTVTDTTSVKGVKAAPVIKTAEVTEEVTTERHLLTIEEYFDSISVKYINGRVEKEQWINIKVVDADGEVVGLYGFSSIKGVENYINYELNDGERLIVLF